MNRETSMQRVGGSVMRACLIGALITGCVLCADWAQAETAAPTPVVFEMQAAVEIDATGAVTNVGVDPAVPQSLRDHAAQIVRTWRFEPVVHEGKAVGGHTYTQLRACAVPVGESYNVAIEFMGNGPGRIKSRRSTPIPLPPAGMMHGSRMELESKLRYRVRDDGRAELLAIDIADPDQASRYGRSWRRAVETWLGREKFLPEMLDGKPVATVVELPMKLVGETRPASSAASLEREIERNRDEVARKASVCQRAADDGDNRAVAVDSPFRRISEG